MQRQATKRLLEWKVSASRKPLILQGPRQVGKTWLMKAFGEREYEHSIFAIIFSLFNYSKDTKYGIYRKIV